jgi:hypothetical protein
LPFLCENFSKLRNFFKRKKLEFSSRRRRLPKSFLAAAAKGRKKLKIFSRRRRERRRLTPLLVPSPTVLVHPYLAWIYKNDIRFFYQIYFK